MAKKSERRRTRVQQEHPSATAPNPEVATLPVWRRSWFPIALYLVLSLIYFWEFPLSDKVIFGEDIGQDYHLGNTTISEKIDEFVPDMWSRQMGGYPISDEIRHNFFPTYLIELFTTHQRAIGWRYILTVAASGVGMFLFLRQIGVGQLASLWAGIAYLSAPTFMTFTLAGHFAKMSVIALFPYFCLCVDRGMTDGFKAARWWLLFSVLIALAAFSPHLQMLQYGLLGIGLFFLYRLYDLWREGVAHQLLALRAGLFTLAVIVGFGLAAEGLLPPYLHVKTHSKRASGEESRRTEEQQLALARSWSLHPEEIGSLVLPEFGGFEGAGGANYYWGRNFFKKNSEYFGITVVFLAIIGLLECPRRRLAWFLGGFFLLVLAFTLGGHTPVHWIAFHIIPGAKVLRTTGMAAFLFAFPAVILAALGLHQMLSSQLEDEARERLSRRIVITGGALTAILALILIAPVGAAQSWISLFWQDIPEGKRQIMVDSAQWRTAGALISCFVIASASALAWARIQGRIGPTLMVAGLAILAIGDTWRIDRIFLRYEEPRRHPDFRAANPRTVAFLKQQPGEFRIFPIPHYGIMSSPQHHLADATIATGMNNYTMRRYDRLMQEFDGVLGVYYAHYFQGQQSPYTDEQLLGAIDPLLDLINVRYLVVPSGIRLETSVYPEVMGQERVRLYENTDALPFSYLVSDAVVATDEDQALEALRTRSIDPRQRAVLEAPLPGPLPGLDADRVTDELYLTEYNAAEGRIRLQSSSKGNRLLILSHNHHPHWTAAVDGSPAQIVRANYVWQAIYLEPGEHAIEFDYRSQPLASARSVASVSLVLVIGVAAWLFRRKAERSPGMTPPTVE